ncbi:MAG TPA: hypothetical protein VG268_11505 [Streptosporangiaceae bacterium]|jgi:hypothetical protein|nr:hypothetical protein [Streptosporangiaceae bacterium]
MESGALGLQQYPDANNAFMSGKDAMIMMGTWYMQYSTGAGMSAAISAAGVKNPKNAGRTDAARGRAAHPAVLDLHPARPVQHLRGGDLPAGRAPDPPRFFISEFSDDQTKVVASAVVSAIPEVVAYLCCSGCLSAA